jgi:hypothetical protein
MTDDCPGHEVRLRAKSQRDSTKGDNPKRSDLHSLGISLLPFQALPPALKRLRVSLPEAGIGRSARCLLEAGNA